MREAREGCTPQTPLGDLCMQRLGIICAASGDTKRQSSFSVTASHNFSDPASPQVVMCMHRPGMICAASEDHLLTVCLPHLLTLSPHPRRW